MGGDLSADSAADGEHEAGAALDAETDATPVVAVVDDDADTRRLLGTILEHHDYAPATYASGREAIEKIGPDVAAVCLDLGLGDMNGLTVMQHLHAAHPDLAVIVVTGARDVDTAVRAMRAGAYDYLTKPIDSEKLTQAVGRAVERHRLAATVSRLSRQLGRADQTRWRLVGESPPMRELGAQMTRVLESDVAVCVLGESGTGKELIARYIHDAGHRAAKPFVAINCAAIPVTLQESELFGHERGAFTGAVGVHRGRFEQAQGGTLFLDEIGEMSPATQAALLRTLQEKSIRRVGGTQEIPVNVRVISATHRDLELAVKDGHFRNDLYFRLVVYPLHVPALRTRVSDIPQLVAHFLIKLQDEPRAVKRVSSDALEALSRHAWPGNVRELENVIHRAILSCDGEEIALRHLPPAIRAQLVAPLPEAPAAVPRPAGAGASVAAAGALPAAEAPLALQELERRAIVDALARTGGSVAAAAKLLGIGRTTLYRRLGALKIGEPGEPGA